MGNNYSLKIYGMYALRTLKYNIYIGLALKPFASQISRNIGVFFATWRLYFELEPTKTKQLSVEISIFVCIYAYFSLIFAYTHKTITPIHI